MPSELPNDFVIPVGAGVGDTPDYVSFTQLSMIERCPQQYEFRYLMGLVEPPGMALSQGIVFHDVAEIQNSHKIETGEDLSTSDVEDAFNDRWKKGHKIGFSRGADATFVPWKEVEKNRTAVDQARRITHAAQVTYHEGKAVKMKPEKAEGEYKLPFLGGKMFIGFIDCVDAADGKRTAIDTKLVGRRYPADAANNSMQLTSYAWAERQGGAHFDRVQFHCVTKKASPDLQILSAPMTKTREQAFLFWAAAQMQIIQGERFVGRVGTHCNWCGYKHRCAWYKGKGFGAVTGPKVTRLSVSARRK